MALPTFDRSNTANFTVIPEGDYDVSLVKSEHKEARSGNDMMITGFVVDNGEHMGAKLENLFYFGHEKQIGEKQLNTLAVHARRRDGSLDPKKDDNGNVISEGGFAYTNDVAGWSEFVKQFLTRPPLRVRVRVKHEFDIEVDGDWKRRVTKEKFDKHVAAGGKGFQKGVVKAILSPPKAAPILEAVPEGAEQTRPAGPATPAYPAPSGDGAATREPVPAVADDDEIPF